VTTAAVRSSCTSRKISESFPLSLSFFLHFPGF
jgi:hypothetical protein